MSKFDNQVVLITGASAGIGAALAQEFAAQGAQLVLLARRTDRLLSLAAQIDPTGQHVLTATCDVAQDGDLERAVEHVRARFGKIDVVVANAGWSVVGNLEDLNLETYRLQWETNVSGVLRTIYATLDELKRSQGRLVVIGSVTSYISLGKASAYSMSKFALRALCESLSGELAPYGISVTHICPGYVATELRQIDNQGVLHSDWQDYISSRLVITAPQAAKHIVHAVYRRQREQVFPAYGKLLVLFQRYLPWITSWLIPFLRGKVGAKSTSKT